MKGVTTEATSPPANVYEGSGQLSVAVPIPGAHAEHTEVIVTPDRLRVTAANKYPQDEQRYHRRDWRVGTWHLELDLPRRVDPARAKATLHYGVLVVMAPISEQGSGESRPRVS
jgi:HSP20 family molecular chaperone IbpA